MPRKFFTSFTLTDGSVVDEGLGKNRVKVIGTDTAQQYFIREVIVSHLGGGSVDVVKDNKVFSVNAQLEKLSKQRAEQVASLRSYLYRMAIACISQWPPHSRGLLIRLTWSSNFSPSIFSGKRLRFLSIKCIQESRTE